MKKWILFILLASCSNNSLEEYEREGQALSRKLVIQLQEIHTREELVKALPNLKDRFDALVSLMIEARRYRADHPDEGVEAPFDPTTSDALMAEMKRIYRIEGGRDLIESAQKEAMIRLSTKG
jgi:hypothetical protein